MKNRNRVFMFLVALALLTAVAWGIILFTGEHSASSALVMFTPGIAALLVSVFTRRSLKDIGWKFSTKWIALGWLIPVVYATLAYGSIWLLGLGDVPNPTFLERARLTLGMPSNSDQMVILAAFVYITIINLLPAAILALGEEMGWRGLLVPELTGWIGLKKASWISGIIWGLWHLPGILFGNYRQIGTPLWYQIICFSILVITTAVVLAYIRIKSDSIIPVVVFHATHNGIIQIFYDRITLNNGNTQWFVGEFGFALVPFLILISYIIYQRITTLGAINSMYEINPSPDSAVNSLS